MCYVLCIQRADITTEQRVEMFDVFVKMKTEPITISNEVEEKDEVEEQYGWVKKDGGLKRKGK